MCCGDEDARIIIDDESSLIIYFHGHRQSEATP
jgi:hypothetical protein